MKQIVPPKERILFTNVCLCYIFINLISPVWLQLPGASPGAISSVVAPVLLKYRVCRPRLLLAGSRAEIDPAADVALLHGEVLLIEDFARQYDPIGGEFRSLRFDFIRFNMSLICHINEIKHWEFL